MSAAGQTNHLKAYGVAFATMQRGTPVEWLLNYEGGSFVTDNAPWVEAMCMARHVSYTKLTDQQYQKIVKQVNDPSFNGAIVKLDHTPKIAVYTPPNKLPWDDAVTLALTYAEIPFDKLYAEEVLGGRLGQYDWLHLHHEDFTGEYGKFWAAYHGVPWYENDKHNMEQMAARHGYRKVSQMQLAVVKKIKDFVGNGGNLFAMCAGTETFDIALAADGLDICDTMFDGDPPSKNVQWKLQFDNCLAFQNFEVSMNPIVPPHSNIDNTAFRAVPEPLDYFTIVSPPAKMDVVPVMLCQNHVKEIPGYIGQTTAYRKHTIKPGVMILGERAESNEARYIHGEYGRGSWTFLGGHDPEDYLHHVSDPPTNLADHPNSPGYRLILNNVLFHAAHKIVVPTFVVSSEEHKEPVRTATPAPASPPPLTASAPATANGIKLGAAKNALTVSSTSGTIEVVVMDLSGDRVMTKTYREKQVTIDISSLPKGMYQVTVNGVYMGRMIRE